MISNEGVMVVYGDPQFLVSSRVFLGWLKNRLGRLDINNLDQVRTVMIQAGQFEQGLHDLSDGGTPLRAEDLAESRRLTDTAAKAFHSKWTEVMHTSDGTVSRPLDEMNDSVDKLQRLEDLAIRVKIPEGYEFYTLYPEQYCATATAWAQDNPSLRRILVIGIRSIGTSLSAAVCAALQAAGREVERLTVRPMGHPFRRNVVLNEVDTKKWDAAIIVDEGPGLSGSSAAATGRALIDLGFAEGQITFFPGHASGPGPMASTDGRRWWLNTPRRITELQEVRWGERNFLDLLRDASAQFGNFTRIEDIGQGRWRKVLNIPDHRWPPIALPFERAKYLAWSDSRPSILWKFAGLGAVYDTGKTALEIGLDRMQALAREDYGPSPLGAAYGFIAMPWISGTALQKSDGSKLRVVEHVWRYFVHFAGLTLAPDEFKEGHRRLSEMAVANVREALGDDWAHMVEELSEQAAELKVLQSYGDGRLCPHEWIRDATGRVYKTDSFGHDIDHTIVGKQSLLWDLAGFVIEWGVKPGLSESLLDSFNQQGVCVEEAQFQFYEVAYCAFRVGLYSLCASVTQDEMERNRLNRAKKRYCDALLHFLSHSRATVYAR